MEKKLNMPISTWNNHKRIKRKRQEISATIQKEYKSTRIKKQKDMN